MNIAVIIGSSLTILTILVMFIKGGRWVGRIETKLDAALNKCTDQPCPPVQNMRVDIQKALDRSEDAKQIALSADGKAQRAIEFAQGRK
jgi:hypothetical protein